MNARTKLPPGKITPLWIVASFLSLTEIILGYALVHVVGSVQIALTVFVIGFPTLVAVAFFIILWSRPWVFYSPSEYGNVDPKRFLNALKESPAVANQIKLVRSIEENPYDEEAKFTLIDSMADVVESQFAILMHETGKDVPRNTLYIYESESGAGSGSLSPYGSGSRLENSGLVRISGNGNYWSLNDEGHRYSEWLLKKGRKYPFFGALSHIGELRSLGASLRNS